MKLIYFLIRLFRQKNKGFSVRKMEKEIKEDAQLGKQHYSDISGELEIKFGGFKKVNPGGQWVNYLPSDEIQKNKYFDTYGCTVFNTENPIQIYQKKVFGIEEEYSERYNGVLAELVIGFGGSPHKAAETYRNFGALPYAKLPFDETITTPQKFYSPKPMTQELINEGQKWLDRFEFGHQWIWNFNHENMMEQLEYSPLGVGVYAWVYDAARGVYYKPNWATDNHWTAIVGYVKGKYWIVYDSYAVEGTHIKHLDWNYPFAFAKRYHMAMKDPNDVNLIEGKKLYSQLKKKHIIVIPGGEAYSVEDNYQLNFEFWTTDSKWLQEKLNIGLRQAEKEGEFTGISRENFDKLKQACILGGGGITANPETINKLKGLIKELTQ